MKIFTVTLPDIGEGVVEGQVIEWLKQVGDSVKQDEPIVSVMTDKATVELPAPTPGILKKQYYKVGETAFKDKPLYDLEIEGAVESIREKSLAVPLVNKKEDVAKKEEKPVVAEGRRSQGAALAAPPVRKLAKEMGISLETIQGTGKNGHIKMEDLQRASSKEAPASLKPLQPDDKEVPLVGISQAMAKKMAEAREHIPGFAYYEQADAEEIVKLKEGLNANGREVKATFIPFFIRALSKTIERYPQINSSFDEHRNALIIHAHHNVGVAFATEKGLVVPVLKNVEKMNFNELVTAYEDLKEHALKGILKPQDMKDGTITLSNLGGLKGKALWAAPVIFYPQVAILATARIQPQPVAHWGIVEPRLMLNLSWTFDHRVIDGALAAEISQYYCSLIENPSSLLEGNRAAEETSAHPS